MLTSLIHLLEDFEFMLLEARIDFIEKAQGPKIWDAFQKDPNVTNVKARDAKGVLEAMVKMFGDAATEALRTSIPKQGDQYDAKLEAEIEKKKEQAKKLGPAAAEKYLQKLVNWYIAGQFFLEDGHKVMNSIMRFEVFRQKLEKKDLNQYKTLVELEKALDPFNDQEAKSNKVMSKEKQRAEWEKKRKKMVEAGDAKILVDTPDLLVVVPNTTNASKFFGNHYFGSTRWCTAGDKGNQFKNYSGHEPDEWLYIIFIRSGSYKGKYQFSFEHNQFHHANDYSIKVDEMRGICNEHPALTKILAPLAIPRATRNQFCAAIVKSAELTKDDELLMVKNLTNEGGRRRGYSNPIPGEGDEMYDVYADIFDDDKMLPELKKVLLKYLDSQGSRNAELDENFVKVAAINKEATTKLINGNDDLKALIASKVEASLGEKYFLKSKHASGLDVLEALGVNVTDKDVIEAIKKNILVAKTVPEKMMTNKVKNELRLIAMAKARGK